MSISRETTWAVKPIIEIPKANERTNEGGSRQWFGPEVTVPMLSIINNQPTESPTVDMMELEDAINRLTGTFNTVGRLLLARNSLGSADSIVGFGVVRFVYGNSDNREAVRLERLYSAQDIDPEPVIGALITSAADLAAKREAQLEVTCEHAVATYPEIIAAYAGATAVPDIL